MAGLTAKKRLSRKHITRNGLPFTRKLGRPDHRLPMLETGRRRQRPAAEPPDLEFAAEKREPPALAAAARRSRTGRRSACHRSRKAVGTALSLMEMAPHIVKRHFCKPYRTAYFIVGMTKEEPSASPPGQRDVTVLILVQNFTPSGPCWLVSPKAERFQPPKV